MESISAFGEGLREDRRALAVLLDKLDLHVARIGEAERHGDVGLLPPILRGRWSKRTCHEPWPDAEPLDIVAHRFVRVLDVVSELDDAAERLSHTKAFHRGLLALANVGVDERAGGRNGLRSVDNGV